MITIFNRKEFTVALTMADQIRLCKPLDEAGIPYIVRSCSATGGGGRNRGRTGTLGVDMDHAYQYRVYVHRSDYERARSLHR